MHLFSSFIEIQLTNKNCVCVRCAMCCFDINIHCEMIGTVINISIISKVGEDHWNKFQLASAHGFSSALLASEEAPQPSTPVAAKQSAPHCAATMFHSSRGAHIKRAEACGAEGGQTWGLVETPGHRKSDPRILGTVHVAMLTLSQQVPGLIFPERETECTQALF